MTYEIEFTTRAKTDLAGLDERVEAQVRHKIDEMAASADIWQHRALTGPLRGYYRLRVGDYRVFYALDRTSRRIAVHRVQHLSEAYRGQ